MITHLLAEMMKRAAILTALVWYYSNNGSPKEEAELLFCARFYTDKLLSLASHDRFPATRIMQLRTARVHTLQSNCLVWRHVIDSPIHSNNAT